MFGFLSLPKLLFTALVIAAVWYGFKWINRTQKLRRENAERDRVSPESAAKRAVEDMVQCPDCGAYVPAHGHHDCGATT